MPWLESNGTARGKVLVEAVLGLGIELIKVGWDPRQWGSLCCSLVCGFLNDWDSQSGQAGLA